jgi:hypothetical protein
MTAVMALLRQALPAHERYPLPPRRVTLGAAGAAGAPVEEMSEPQRQGLTALAHFGYGAGAGAVYAALAPHLTQRPVLGGVAFGLGVWAASYLGWLPALGLPASAPDETPRRNALMIAAHLVYGGALGLLTDALADGQARPEAAP